MGWENDITYEKATELHIDKCGRMVFILVHTDTKVVLNGENRLILGPSLVCMNGYESIDIEHGDLEIITFTIQFLCRSVNEELMRRDDFWELASQHNLFFLSPFLNSGDYKDGVIYLNPYIYSFICEQLIGAQNAYSDKSDGRWSCKTRAFLMEILVQFEKEKLEGIDQCKLKKGGLSWQIITYIRSHYNKRIDPSKLAEEFGQNRSVIFSIFKIETGYTLTEYIARYRVFVAKHILAFTEITVGEIAERVGYENQSSFTRVFKTQIGISPEEFRRTAVEARKANLNKKQPSPGTAMPEDGCTHQHKG